MRDGRTVFAQEIPGAGPTVVFEAGLGASRSLWGDVQPAVGEKFRSVVYDRSGLGRSPLSSGSRRLPQLADDLSDLLDGLGDGPFVLVGHSWGGPIVRLAATQRPERIVGIVLVDPSDEACEMYYSRLVAVLNDVQRWLFPPLARLGVLGRLVAREQSQLPESIRDDLRREMYTPTAVTAQIAEAENPAGDLRDLQKDPPELPDVPFTVISAISPSGVGRENRRQLIEAHAFRAATSPQGRHVHAEKSAHIVMRTEPELITQEINKVCASCLP